MNKVFKFATTLLVASLLAGSALAQVKVQPNIGAPKVMVPPKIILIKPSQALRIAMKSVPNGKALKVSLQNGARPVYKVQVKSQNQVRLLLIDATNGGLIP